MEDAAFSSIQLATRSFKKKYIYICIERERERDKIEREKGGRERQKIEKYCSKF